MFKRYLTNRFINIIILFQAQFVSVMGDPLPEQTLQGSISGILSKAHSPYYALDHITVDDGDTLVIEPGVKILFYPECKFYIGKGWMAEKIYPQLIAIGTGKDSIVFTALDPAKGWGGLQFNMSGSDDTLACVVIKEIRAIQSHDSWSLTAGAISVLNSSPMIRNSTIRFNYVENTPLFNFFDYSSISPQAFDPCAPHLQNCVIQNNLCNEEETLGGPIFSSMQVTALLENLLVVNNQMGHFITYGGATVQAFINITVAQNKLHFNPFMGVLVSGSGNVMILFKNSIIFNNDADFHSLFCGPENGDILQFEYSNIDTNLVNVYWNAQEQQWDSVRTVWKTRSEINWGEGNIVENPLFFNEIGSNFILSEGSPCVDAGDPQAVYDDVVDPDFPDWASFPAQGTARNDMGAYGGKSGLPYSPISTDTEQQAHSVDQFVLGDNYPNPFNPETVIPYQLSKSSFVTLNIYNILGQCVQTLIQRVQKTGMHEALWDGNDSAGNPVGSGVYFYRIQAGDFSEVKKMVLIR